MVLPNSLIGSFMPTNSRREVENQNETCKGSFMKLPNLDTKKKKWFSLKRSKGGNYVQTAKYTFWNFLFKCGAEQLQNAQNVYFLVVIIMAYVGEFTDLYDTPFAGTGTLFALLVVVSFAMTFEGYYDIKRHREDKKINMRQVQRLRSGDGHIETITWAEVKQGDVLKIYDRDYFPADLVFIRSCSDTNRCYVETSNIDGETNLKIKHVPKDLGDMCYFPEIASSLEGNIKYESPNAFLSFSGSIEIVGPPKAFEFLDKSNIGSSIDIDGKLHVPLEFSNLLLRGSVLRNTPWILGLVVYTGKDTKVVQSSEKSPSKASRIQYLNNRIVIFILFILVFISTISSLLEIYVYPDDSEFWYLGGPAAENQYIFPPFVANFCTFIILYSGLVPISLLVIRTFFNLIQALLIRWDLEMYHEETDTAAQCKTLELVQELGQVNYVFSDKTGTLTRNEMKVIGCSVGSTIFGLNDHKTDNVTSDADLTEIFNVLIDRLNNKKEEDEELSSKLYDFLLVLSVCHTVLVDDSSGDIKYNAEGPDEEALVNAASSLGFRLLSTVSNEHKVEVKYNNLTEVLTFKVLATNQFNSERKRMSCLIQKPDNSYVLLAKGADSTMFKRMLPANTEEEKLKHDILNDHLDCFSNDGFRTLVMGKRVLEPDEVSKWMEQYNASSNLLGVEKEQALAQAAENIEIDFEIIGASAIEDRLQEEVPETLTMLREAGIKTWVLTGDKVETAINIGFSSNLLTPDMQVVRVTSDVHDENMKILRQVTDLFKPENLQSNSKQRQIGRAKLLKEAECESKPTGKMLTLVGRQIENLKGIPQWGSNSKRRSEKASPTKDRQVSKVVSFDMNEPEKGREEGTINVREFRGDEKDIEGFEAQNLALVLSGDSLKYLLSTEHGDANTEKLLLTLAKICTVVIACRMSPKQKALVVRMVKKNVKIKGKSVISLAIGDGANDVAMIQEASVGIGISGHEGRQAVNSSDFSIAQFRYLKPLLLVHGRWNYRRAATSVLFVFYTQIIFVMTFVYYNFYNKFSGSTIFYEFLLAFYSYPTNACIAILAVTNKDISRETVLQYPAIYISGRCNRYLSNRKIGQYVLRCMFHATIICAVQFMWLGPEALTLPVLGVSVYFNCILVSVGRCCLETYNWTWPNFTMLGFGLLFLFIFEPIYFNLDPEIYTTNGGTVLWRSTYGEPGYIFRSCIFSTTLCLLLDVFCTYLRKEYFPRMEDIVVEIDRGYSTVEGGKQHILSNMNRRLKQLGQPFRFSKAAISELMSSIQNVNIRQAKDQTSFTFDAPSDEHSAPTRRRSRRQSASLRYFRKRAFDRSPDPQSGVRQSPNSMTQV